MGLAPVKLDGKWAYINTKGQMVIPALFDDADDFSVNGLVMGLREGKCCFINAKGERMVALIVGGSAGRRRNPLVA